MKQIQVSDFSLRALSEERQLLFREKTAIVSALCKMNADTIELPALCRPKEDCIVYKTISAAAQGKELAVDAAGKDPQSIIDTFAGYENLILQLELPVSPIQMEYSLGLKENALLDRVQSRVSELSKLCKTEFVALDAFRCSREFLLKVCTAAQGAGASRITLSDDSGEALPSETAEYISLIKSEIKLPIYYKASDKLGLALANAMEAVKMGCDGLKLSCAGANTLGADKLEALTASRGSQLGIQLGLNGTSVHSICSQISKVSVSSEESGRPQGGDDDIFLDSDSGIEDVKNASLRLGYELSSEDIGKVYDSLRHICEKKSSVGKREFEAIISSSAMQVPSTYHLDSYSINTGNLTTAMAYICLVKDGEKINGIATGDGPIDSAFNAIDMAIGYHYQLDDFQIQAITEGKESLGSTIVKLRSDSGKLYSGHGLSSDIVGAGIRAYINALNKIVYEEQQ